jgi:glycosyltransferase involved in cell wall biosynthesis
VTVPDSPARSLPVSVVIPCYNYGHLLAEAIDSALGQSHPPIEVIIVDDGSTDDTAAVVASYGASVRYVAQSNSGPACARNTGARAALGAYVVFLDADDVLSRTYVEETLRALTGADARVGYVYTQMRSFDRSEETTAAPQFDPKALLRNNYVHVSALLRIALAREIGYDERLRQGWEDWDFYLRLCEGGVTGLLLDRPLLLYRRHRDGRSLQDGLDLERKRKLYRSLAWRHRRLFRHRPLLLAGAIIGGFVPNPLWVLVRASRRRLSPAGSGS